MDGLKIDLLALDGLRYVYSFCKKRIIIFVFLTLDHVFFSKGPYVERLLKEGKS